MIGLEGNNTHKAPFTAFYNNADVRATYFGHLKRQLLQKLSLDSATKEPSAIVTGTDVFNARFFAYFSSLYPGDVDHIKAAYQSAYTDLYVADVGITVAQSTEEVKTNSQGHDIYSFKFFWDFSFFLSVLFCFYVSFRYRFLFRFSWVSFFVSVLFCFFFLLGVVSYWDFQVATLVLN